MTTVPGHLGWVDELISVWREGQRRSMVGPGDPSVHLHLARRLAAALDAPGRALDLGSGAGIPGLALAGLWPASRWTLLDAAQRRVVFLAEAVERLGWQDRVAVVHGRAEELGHATEHREQYALVIARSFGAPAVTAECGAAFVEVGGRLAVTEPPGGDPARWPPEPLVMLGLEPLAPDAGVQVLVKRAALSDRYPRRPGMPAKRPLY